MMSRDVAEIYFGRWGAIVKGNFGKEMRQSPCDDCNSEASHEREKERRRSERYESMWDSLMKLHLSLFSECYDCGWIGIVFAIGLCPD